MRFDWESKLNKKKVRKQNKTNVHWVWNKLIETSIDSGVVRWVNTNSIELKHVLWMAIDPKALQTVFHLLLLNSGGVCVFERLDWTEQIECWLLAVRGKLGRKQWAYLCQCCQWINIRPIEEKYRKFFSRWNLSWPRQKKNVWHHQQQLNPKARNWRK